MVDAGSPHDLSGLLAGAERATPADRIEWRDGIAAFGAPAIEAITPWLGNPRLAAFAVRVIERAGRDGRDGEREAAIQTLRGARRGADPRVRSDIDWALLKLKVPRST